MTSTLAPNFTISTDRRPRPKPRFTPEQRELHMQARAQQCPVDGNKFRHLIDNTLHCARCGQHAAVILGTALPVFA